MSKKNETPDIGDQSFNLTRMIEDLERQTTIPVSMPPKNLTTSPNQHSSVSGTLVSGPKESIGLKQSPIIEPSKPEILSITTKIHSFDKPVFIALSGSKVYTLFGKVPVLRTPEVSTKDIEMHVINDEEIGYSIPQYISEEEDEYGILFDDSESISAPSSTIFVVCGKNFGTRKLDALASILLKLDAPQIIVQKYSYNKNNKSAQWVPKYNKQITKLEHYIHKFLRNNE